MGKGKILIAADHGGFDLKRYLVSKLAEEGYEMVDLGTDSTESVDYPDYARKLAVAIGEGQGERGILICGTGIGISMAANRHTHIRAALVHDAFTARMGRMHNDANVICLGGRILGPDLALDCVKVFLETSFDGGRHKRRVDKMGKEC